MKTILRIFLAMSIVTFQPVASAAYEWHLKSFESSGDVNFLDEFDDGLISTGPTGQFINWNNSTNTEIGGSLIFTDSDGINPAGSLGFDLMSFGPIPDGGGVTTLTGVFRPDLAEVAASPVGSGYWIQVFKEGGGDGAILGVFSDGLGNAGIGLFDEVSTLLETHLLTVASGDIVLQMDLDTTNDLIVARYSTDSGVTFNAVSATAGLIGNGRFLAGGQGPVAPIPLPPMVWSFGIALLLVMRRSKSTARP